MSLFEGVNYTGRSTDIKPGEYTAADLRAAGIDPASIRSVKLNNDRRLSYKLTLFSEDHFGGSTRSYIFNIPNLQALPGFEAAKSLKLETVTLENINKGSSAECSINNEESSAVTDGDETTRWIVNDEGPKWVKTDMGSVHTIHRIIIKHASSHSDTKHNNNQDFKVSISNDGIGWTEVASVTGNMDYASVIDFEPAAARYVKVDIAKGSRIPPHTRVTISEIEVYGIKNTLAEDGSAISGNLAQEDGIGGNKGKGDGTGTGKDSSPGGSVGRNSWLWLAFTSLMSVLVITVTVVLRRRERNA